MDNIRWRIVGVMFLPSIFENRCGDFRRSMWRLSKIESVPTNRTLFSTGPLSVQLKRSYRLHASIKAYFVGKKALGRRSCSR